MYVFKLKAQVSKRYIKKKNITLSYKINFSLKKKLFQIMKPTVCYNIIVCIFKKQNSSR